MPNEWILVIEEIKHAEKTNFVELYELLVDTKEVLILVACESPEMGETLDGGFFVRCVMGVEGTLDGLSELVGEILAESYYQIDDLGVHMGVV
jgi:hypothetical protein